MITIPRQNVDRLCGGAITEDAFWSGSAAGANGSQLSFTIQVVQNLLNFDVTEMGEGADRMSVIFGFGKLNADSLVFEHEEFETWQQFTEALRVNGIILEKESA